MSDNEEKTFRSFEKYLDSHHKTLDAWSSDRNTAIYGVLTVPDIIFLTLMLSPTPPLFSTGSTQFLHRLDEGVTQALRWLTSECDYNLTSTNNRKEIEQAHEFTFYAANYSVIADFHSMIGRKLATYSIDEANRIVQFNSVVGPGISDTSAWHDQMHGQSRRGFEKALTLRPDSGHNLREECRKITSKLEDGRIVLGEISSAAHQIFCEFNLNTSSEESIPLPADADLIEFTVTEYWSFVNAVSTWSHVVFMKYLTNVRSGIAQERTMPTQIVDRIYFIDQLSRLTGLQQTKVNTILDRFTFGKTRVKDICLTPFLCRQNKIAWSPSLFIKRRHERNLLKVLAKGTKELQDCAATVNGYRDSLLARKVLEKLNKYGYTGCLERPVSDPNKKTDIDVLAWRSKKPTEVLLVECKAIVAPDDINEVNDASKAIMYGQSQIDTAIEILRNLPNNVKQNKFKFVPWDKVVHYRGIVVTADGDPHSLVDQSRVPTISLSSILNRLKSK